MRTLCRLGALVLVLSLPPPAPSHLETPSASTLAPETSVNGGSVFMCVASGILFGASVLSGNALGAASAVVSAIHNGCL